MSSAGRVLHITLEKCGSQWIRDILTAPEIVAISGVQHSGFTSSIHECTELALPPGTFAGPIYGMNQWEWSYWSSENDRAIVVFRDPRDMTISLMYSWLYSHAANSHVSPARRVLSQMPNDDVRLNYLIPNSGLSVQRRMYRTWLSAPPENALIVKYETLIENNFLAFVKIFQWLGWNVPDEVTKCVTDRLSFTSMSGRERGAEDKFSHFRKGVAGDWRNFFTREHGELWESKYPGFLCDIGYETTTDWWKDLPQRATKAEVGTQPDLRDERVASLQASHEHLLKQLQEKEAVIQHLLRIKYSNVARLAIYKLFNALRAKISKQG